MTRGGAAAKVAGGLGRLRALGRAGAEGALAISGDPRAIAKLAGRALRRVWRSPLARRVTAAVAVTAVVGVLSVVGGAGGGTAAGVEGTTGAQFGAEPMVWAAYTVAGRVWCAPDGAVRLSGDALPEPWQRTDWRLVAAVGGVESGHAAGRSVNAFGDVWPPVLGPTLDGTIDGLVTIPDTDSGRFDLDTRWDRAVGPMQLLPSTVATAGVDGNGDWIVDPHNLWDATATASAYLCVAGIGRPPSEAVFAYNHSDVYVGDVLAGLAEIVTAGVEEGHAGRLPDGAPLPYRPSTADAGTVLGSIVEHLGGDPAAVRCSTGCSWRVERPPETVPEWEPLSDVGYAAPVRVPGGVTDTGDGTLQRRLCRRWVRCRGPWPLATAAVPQPARSRAAAVVEPLRARRPPGLGRAQGSKDGDGAGGVGRARVRPAGRAAVTAARAAAHSVSATAAGWLWRSVRGASPTTRSPLSRCRSPPRVNYRSVDPGVCSWWTPTAADACPQRTLWALGGRDGPFLLKVWRPR